MTFDETAFETLADNLLARLMDCIETQRGDSLDVDLQDGILTIELDAGGEYVINKHAPNRQIWVSSPVSGASHFAYVPESGAWLSTRADATALLALLGDELGVDIDAPEAA